VDAAAEVAATSRGDAVNERIKNLAASPGPDIQTSHKSGQL
jgi:hypothetical protein